MKNLVRQTIEKEVREKVKKEVAKLSKKNDNIGTGEKGVIEEKDNAAEEPEDEEAMCTCTLARFAPHRACKCISKKIQRGIEPPSIAVGTAVVLGGAAVVTGGAYAAGAMGEVATLGATVAGGCLADLTPEGAGALGDMTAMGSALAGGAFAGAKNDTADVMAKATGALSEMKLGFNDQLKQVKARTAGMGNMSNVSGSKEKETGDMEGNAVKEMIARENVMM